MGHAHFEHAHFLVAARELAREGGPAQVTVASVIDRLKAPKGSFYYRFAWGDVDATSLRLSQFVLADAPLAAVRPHLQRREKPPALVDEIITITYRSLTVGRPTPTAGFQREPKA